MNSNSEKNKIQNIKHEMSNSSQRVSKQQQNIYQATDIDNSENERNHSIDERKKDDHDENLNKII